MGLRFLKTLHALVADEAEEHLVDHIGDVVENLAPALALFTCERHEEADRVDGPAHEHEETERLNALLDARRRRGHRGGRLRVEDEHDVEPREAAHDVPGPPLAAAGGAFLGDPRCDEHHDRCCDERAEESRALLAHVEEQWDLEDEERHSDEPVDVAVRSGELRDLRACDALAVVVEEAGDALEVDAAHAPVVESCDGADDSRNRHNRLVLRRDRPALQPEVEHSGAHCHSGEPEELHRDPFHGQARVERAHCRRHICEKCCREIS